MEKNMKMREIAELAGVSTMTVSNVVHGRDKKVGQETRRRVQMIMEEMNYHVNAKASLLAGQRIKLIVILDGTSPIQAEGEHFYRRLKVMEKEIYSRKQYALIHFVNRVEEGVQFVREWEADGVISIGFTEEEERYLREYCDCPLLFWEERSLGEETERTCRESVGEFIEVLYK